MKIKYLGPSPEVNVAPYGPHRKDEDKDYPDEFAEELLATSKKQHFKAVEKEQGSKGESVQVRGGESEQVSEEAPEIPLEDALEDFTVRELIAMCEAHEPPILVPKKARKAELIKLLEG